MKLRHLITINTAALVIIAITIAASLYWGLQEFKKPRLMKDAYFSIRYQVSQQLHQHIEAYLSSGDATRLGEAEQLLETLAQQQVIQLPPSVQPILLEQFERIRTYIQTRLRAAGKLSGSHLQTLLIQNERDFSDGLQALALYAGDGHDKTPQHAFDYLQIINQLSTISAKRSQYREKYFETLSTQHLARIEEYQQELEIALEKLNRMLGW